MSKPKYLFKFEPFNEQTLKNLKEGVLFFSTPNRFNDPYDCNLEPGFVDLNDEEAEEIRENWIREELDLSNAQKFKLQNMTIAHIKELAIQGTKQAFNNFRDTFLNKRGVCCFSESNDDLLMWAHYGGSYAGFCLEFDTKHEPFDKLFKVSYQDEIPKFDASLVMTDENDITIDNLLTKHIFSFFSSKSMSWAYEQEWRCFHEEANKAYTYTQSALKSIYFGPRMSQTEQEIICLIVKGQNRDVKFFEGYQNHKEFKVDFKEFEYMDYITAKSKNLL